MPKSKWTMDALTEWQKQDEKLGTPQDYSVTVHRESYQNPGRGASAQNPESSEKLRMHHFKLGYRSYPTQQESNMKATFKDPGPPLKETQGEEDMREAKLEELLQANFCLGSDHNPEQYVSVHTAEISAPARIKPKPTAKIDSSSFRDHNVVLGSDKPFYTTHMAETFVDHGSQSMASVEERMQKRAEMRRASFSFGSYGLTYTSTSADSYMEQPIHPDLVADLSARAALEKVNYTLGSDYEPRRSEAREAFGLEQALKDQCAKREIPDKEKKKELNAAHWIAGHDPTSYGTIAGDSYSTPMMDKEYAAQRQTTRERTRQLRLSNVTLGQDNVEKISLEKSTYVHPPADCEAFLPMSEKRKGYLDGVHYEYGFDTDELKAERSKPFSHHAAVSGLRNVDYSQLTGLRDEPDFKVHLQKSSVHLGNMPGVKTTTHIDGYQEYIGHERRFVSEEQRRALRQAHFSFGNDNVFNKDLCTVSKECFGQLMTTEVDKSQSEESSKNFKTSSVMLGIHDIDYCSEHHTMFKDPVVNSPPPKKKLPIYLGHEQITSEKQHQFKWPERPKLSAAGINVVTTPRTARF